MRSACGPDRHVEYDSSRGTWGTQVELAWTAGNRHNADVWPTALEALLPSAYGCQETSV
jgi:hypothetical protein